MGFVKTTIEINGSLLDRARKLATERFTTLRNLIEEGLRQIVEAKPRRCFKLRDGSFGRGGMLRDLHGDEILDEIYKGRGA